jgi:hypothetical protein
MSVRAFKTADELQDMIVEQARTLHGPWPSGMTMFVFDDAYGWSASISQGSFRRRRCQDQRQAKEYLPRLLTRRCPAGSGLLRTDENGVTAG